MMKKVKRLLISEVVIDPNIQKTWLELRTWRDNTFAAYTEEPLVIVPNPDIWYKRLRPNSNLFSPYDIANHMLIDRDYRHCLIGEGFPGGQFDDCFVGCYIPLPLDYFDNEY